MKRKRNLRGFSAIELVIGLVVLATLGSTGWYVVRHHRQKPTPPVAADYVPKEITVVFKNGTTAQQALDLISSYKLSLDPGETTDIINAYFTPTSQRAIKDDQFTQIADKLKAYPKVMSFTDISSDPGSRAGKGEKWVQIIYRQDTTYEQIKTILHAAGLSPPIIVQDHMLDLSAPVGKEQFYVDKLKQNPIVRDAYRDEPPSLT